MPPSRLPARAALLATLGTVVVLSGCGGAQVRKAHFMARGEDYLAHGQYQMARIEFRNALQIAPKDAEARYLNGLVAEKLGDVAHAAGLYQSAIDVQPDDIPARVHLARLYLLYGYPKKALESLQPSLAKHPDDPRLLTMKAAVGSRLKDPAALAYAQKAYKLAPRNEETVAVLTGLYLKAGRQADAQALLERAIEDIPDTVSLRLALAGQFEQANELGKAEALLKQLIGLQPKSATNRIELAHFYAASSRLNDAEAVLRQGMKDLPDSAPMRTALIDFLRSRRGEDAAENELHTLVAARPDDTDLHFELAALYAAAKKVPQAQAEYRTVIGMQQSSQSVLEAKDDLAELRLRAGDTQGAQTLIAQVLAKDPDDNASLRLRAVIELAQRQPGAAIQDLRTILRDQPDSAPDLRMLANAQLASGEPDSAQQTLRQAVDADPRDPSAALDLVALLSRLGQPAEAQQIADPLARRFPKDRRVLTAAFQAEFATKSLGAAAASAAALQAVAPQSPLGYYFSGLAADASGDSAGAIRDYHQALAIAPTAQEPLEALTRLYGREGKTALALEELDHLAQSQPRDPIPRVLAGEIQLALKQPSAASQSFKAALALDASFMPAYRGLAHVELAQKDPDAAIQTLESARGKVKPLETPDLDLASLYERLGRRSEAIDAYRQALKANPASDEAANDLALLLCGGGSNPTDLAQALQLAQRFSNSSNPYYVDTLGWVEYERGDLTHALTTLGQAVNLAPGDSVLRYHLAMAELKSGQTVVARDNLQKALSGGKPFEGMAEARSVLTRLGSPSSPTASASTRD